MSYDQSRRRGGYGATGSRSPLGYWIPLAVTVTVATAGLATWIWSERKDSDRRDRDGKGGDVPPQPGYRPDEPSRPPYSTREAEQHQQHQQTEEEGLVSRMSGALRRTPSPQQIFDSASRRVAAGVTAAGAVVGGALASIREEDRKDFEDHSRWSEEAESRRNISTSHTGTALPGANIPADLSQKQAPSLPKSNDRRKAVAIVVSAEVKHDAYGTHDDVYHQEHASILSHLPEHVGDDCRVFIMLYTPDLKDHPLSSNSTSSARPAASLSSSFSNIGHDDLHTPREDEDRPLTSIDPQPLSTNSSSKLFNALHKEAQTLVEKETMIMPFTTPTGYVHLLRHIAPEIVYVQATLSGTDGEAVKHISGWVGQVVLVVGDETGHGGLVDSEDERGVIGHERQDRWWQDDPRIGLGKGMEVVEGLRIGEDWKRRVRGHA